LPLAHLLPGNAPGGCSDAENRGGNGDLDAEIEVLTEIDIARLTAPPFVQHQCGLDRTMQELRSRICFVTPDPHPSGMRAVDLARRAVTGGAGMVLYRGIGLTARAMIEEATAILQFARPVGVPLIIEGRVDVALAVGADGAHLGAGDLPVATARRLMGPRAIVGVAVASQGDTRIAERDVATYVSIGPLFDADCQPGQSRDGMASCAVLRRATSLPICASGGINAQNITSLASDPPDLLGVGTAICAAPDAAAATRELLALIERHWHIRRPPP
jgi:thiamine-phosphate pyrophosphorylase